LVEGGAADGLINSAPTKAHETNRTRKITQIADDFIFALG